MLDDGHGLLAPLCGLYPLADNHADDLAFATLRPADDPRSWIYLFEGSESESLQRTHFSIAHFIWSHALAQETIEDPLFGAEDEASLAFATEQAAWQLEPLEDPEHLFARSRWLLRAMAEQGDFVQFAKSRVAPGLAQWQEERTLLGEAPHLAIHWLLSHWLANNPNALAECLTLTEHVQNADVRAIRRWVSTRKCEGFHATVFAELPARMCERRTSAPKPISTSTFDRDAEMIAAKGNVRVHEQLLSKLAPTSDVKMKRWIKTYSSLVAGMSSHREEGARVQREWAAEIDERMLLPAVGLVLRSFTYPKQLDPRALFWIIAALGRLGPTSPHRELVLHSLLSAPTTKLCDERLIELVEAVARFDDPRVEPWLEGMAVYARRTSFQLDEELFAAALGALAAKNPARAAPLLTDVLGKSDRRSSWFHASAKKIAAELGALSR